MIIDLVLPFFPFGSPPFQRLVGGFRRRLIEEVASSPLPGLVLTFVWAFDQPGDTEFIEGDHGDVSGTRWSDGLRDTTLRLAEKPSKRNAERSGNQLLELEGLYRMTSDGNFPFPGHLWIDNTHLDPEEVAARVVTHCSLGHGTDESV